MLSLRDVSNALQVDLSICTNDTKLVELGIDSLRLMQFVGLIEEHKPHVHITEEAMLALTVGDVKALLRSYN